MHVDLWVTIEKLLVWHLALRRLMFCQYISYLASKSVEVQKAVAQYPTGQVVHCRVVQQEDNQ